MIAQPPFEVFPELISVRHTLHWVAHSSEDWNEIQRKYHSHAEREHVEAWARSLIIEQLKAGTVKATGRNSKTLAGTKIPPKWEARRYKHHDGWRSYVPKEFWTNAVLDFLESRQKVQTRSMLI